MIEIETMANELKRMQGKEKSLRKKLLLEKAEEALREYLKLYSQK